MYHFLKSLNPSIKKLQLLAYGCPFLNLIRTLRAVVFGEAKGFAPMRGEHRAGVPDVPHHQRTRRVVNQGAH
jgi:hypothetical protein